MNVPAEINRVAVIESSGRRCSREELDQARNRLVHAFQAAGLVEGDAVAILAPNCIEYLAAYSATVHAGMYFVPVNWNLAPAELDYILNDSAAKLIIVHETIAPEVLSVLASRPGALKARVSIGALPGFIAFADFIAGHPDALPASPGRGSVLRYTSATTGVPKAVRRTRVNAVSDKSAASRMQAAMNVDVREEHVHLCNSKLYHTPVLVLTAIELEMGHTVVLMTGSWDERLALQLIETHRVTTTFMVPTMFVRLLRLPSDVRAMYDVSSLRHVLHAAAPCPVEVKQAMIDWFGPIIWERYGSVEGPVTLVDSHDWLRYPGTVGRPEAGIHVKILGDDGEELPAGEVGVIFVRSLPSLEFEYKGDVQKTLASRRGDYYTVGDMGYLNEEGFLFVCDRKIDMIISGGVNIYSAEIEQALILHPAVADCAVFGVPDEVFGEVPKAVIQLVPGVEDATRTTESILAFLASRLAKMKLPKQIDYVAAIPRDPNGKLYKRLLRSAPANATNLVGSTA